MSKTKGTKEWAIKNINFSKGCSNACRYCYARRMANRFGWKLWNDWPNMENKDKIALKKFQKSTGTIMIPSSHDITPKNVHIAKKVIKNLLVAGNNILIVSKPNLEVIRELSDYISKFKDQVLWRFTIGTLNDDKREFWEPGAPSIQERLTVLKEMSTSCWSTSVSIEPFLDNKVDDLIKVINPFVSDTIWIGPMNKTHVPKELWTKNQKKLYSPESLYKLKNEIDALGNPKIRFKDHFLSTIKKYKGIID